MITLIIGAVLWVAGGLAAWGLCAHAGRLDDAAGRGDEPWDGAG